MPNRYIREAAIESERVNAVSWQGEVFWRRLMNRVDDFGRIEANAQLLRASIFPLQIQKVSEKDIERLIKECEESGLLAAYVVGGKRYLVLNKWERGRAKKSKYPDPPEDICKRLQTFVYGCGHPQTDAPDSDSDSDNDFDSGSDHICEKALESLRLRIGSWFNRRPTTQWSEQEVRALRKVLKLNTPPDDIDLLEKRYLAKAPFIRREIATLLNNWNGEIDKARNPDQASPYQPALIGTSTPDDAAF